MSEEHNIAVIPGDLNGITVTNAAVKVSEALTKLLTKPIKHTTFDYNADYFIKNDLTELGEKELSELKKYDQIFLGAIGDPTKIKPGVVEVGILLKLRQEFDQYVNLRPVVLPQGVASILVGKDYKDINFEICRENSEGLYVGEGKIENEGTDEEAGIQIMKCTYKGVKRLAEYAVQRAIARKKGGKPTMHFVFKTNVLKYAGAPWIRVFDEMKERTDVDIKYLHIDNFLMQMLINPAQFDVVITENMFGDISTDAGAVIQGGIGSAVSGNINPTGEMPSMFEPIHGSAPDKWYELDKNGMCVPGTFVEEKLQEVKPEAAFMSYAMMLDQMGEEKAAKALKDAALNNIRNKNYKTMKKDELVENTINFIKEYKG
ncbi:MAG: 3-isopropylmalate dehydrogenase [Candidatus Diapherotrites archaeon]|jgi:3-isopropylmalate dehydrogenase|uniref:3-isopropylmalate dehydrogenase n=1 Tax=Candidatus Iainarchaeum sp. TaxID=3101447 RepID=A0A8T5GFA4_9ARCH|nr:3-isopropylmalate dehydrogenase [Candidatus Diapherotrites archaeon]MBT7240914.1 3-isopropylmalate dehydrogenase [Candidatus Diapherotrites archaeon]